MRILCVQEIDFQPWLFVDSVAMDRNGMANNNLQKYYRSCKNWNSFEVQKVNNIVYLMLLCLIVMWL